MAKTTLTFDTPDEQADFTSRPDAQSRVDASVTALIASFGVQTRADLVQPFIVRAATPDASMKASYAVIAAEAQKLAPPQK